MATLTLSTGTAIESEDVQEVEYYPSGSLRTTSIIKGFVALRDVHFLYIRTTARTTHVIGPSAARDADAIEQAGVRVYRRLLA